MDAAADRGPWSCPAARRTHDVPDLCVRTHPGTTCLSPRCAILGLLSDLSTTYNHLMSDNLVHLLSNYIRSDIYVACILYIR